MRRKHIYEALHPETRHGGNQSGPCRRFGETETPPFSTDTAARTGRSERDVQRGARRGTRITNDVLAAVQGTEAATGATLDRRAAKSRSTTKSTYCTDLKFVDPL